MFHSYTGNEPFDLQINRVTRDFEGDSKLKENLDKIIPVLKDRKSWFDSWVQLAALRKKKGYL